MSTANLSREEVAIQRAVARLRAGILALVCGLLAATGLFLATAWLVIRGGPNVGQHLVLLSIYLPGYTVSWAGACVGLVYGFVLGGIVGWVTGWIYNRVVDLRG